MGYPSCSDLRGSYEVTFQIIQKQTEGLDHADSVLQPPNRGNCMNWVLGHIIVGRNTALRLLSEEPVWDRAVDMLYKSGSEPITLPDQARPFEAMLEDLGTAQSRLVEALGKLQDADLETIATTDRGTKPIGEHLHGLHWHETYHTGQFEYLRQLAGRIEPIL
jgi:uncharacterized damage-inducible protein DinB